MVIPDTDVLSAFAWTPQPAAGRLIDRLVEAYLDNCPAARALAMRMREQTGTRFRDWVDSLVVSPEVVAEACEAGFVQESAGVWHHPGGLFPHLRVGRGLRRSPRERCGSRLFPHLRVGRGRGSSVLLKVESVSDFLAANDAGGEAVIEGEPLSPLRLAWGEVSVVERHGERGYAPLAWDAEQTALVLRHAEALRLRPRNYEARKCEDEEEGFSHLRMLLDAAVTDLGVDRACDLFFAAERDYWQRRNDAARVQKARQDRLGLGWANHDHHTYRSSRRHFAALVGVFESLGLRCRERFYAGREAGWGAQVMEQPRAGIVVFADVDLLPEEVMGDFAHEPLAPAATLGTVGLWCGLHGESILEAGMHHLECQFDFDALASQLQREAGIGVMKPFTDLPYLKQAFTQGQRWPVAEGRIARLLRDGLITAAEADQFRREGAIGSHLENLERHDGFKGFNQKGVSEIIAATDPRNVPRKVPPRKMSPGSAPGRSRRIRGATD